MPQLAAEPGGAAHQVHRSVRAVRQGWCLARRRRVHHALLAPLSACFSGTAGTRGRSGRSSRSAWCRGRLCRRRVRRCGRSERRPLSRRGCSGTGACAAGTVAATATATVARCEARTAALSRCRAGKGAPILRMCRRKRVATRTATLWGPMTSAAMTTAACLCRRRALAAAVRVRPFLLLLAVAVVMMMSRPPHHAVARRPWAVVTTTAHRKRSTHLIVER